MSSRGSPQILSGATNTTIHGGTFTAVNGDMHIHSPGSKRYGLELLLANISQGAFHNAAERGDPPRCHPRTRTAIRTEMMEWIKATDAQRKLIFWLYGPAGTGKTAIEQSIAEQCEEEGMLAASFFFSRTAAGRNSASRFIATIAYQLSRSIPELREVILAAVEDDPTIFSRSLSVQMRTLVVIPLKSVRLSGTPRAVVVDGIDECGPDGRSQAELLKVLGAAAVELVQIPIIFVVASRPEFDIRLTFNQEPLRSLMKGLFLDRDTQADADIRNYFMSKFQEVREKQLALGTDLPLPWPTDSDIYRLVRKSSGQFIFAATVVKFIDDPRRHPIDRLNIILGLSKSAKETPFDALDSLYRHILSAVDDLPKVLEALTVLMLGNDNTHPIVLPVGLVERLLGFEVRRTLMDLHALLYIPPPGVYLPTIRVHHASFFDFLMDPSRSREYFIDVRQGHIFLCKRWLEMIATHHTFQPRSPPLNFSIGQFARHFKEVSPSFEVTDYLGNFGLRAVLDNITNVYDMYTIHWNNFFECAAQCQQESPQPNTLHRFRHEYYDSIMDRVAQYPSSLQPYVAALFCHPDYVQTHLLFSLVLKNAGESEAMLIKLDQKLLMIQQRPRPPGRSPARRGGEDSFILAIFKEKAALGGNYLDIGRSFAALVKLVFTVYLHPGEVKPPVGVPDEGSVYPDILTLLRNSSVDLDLAQMLQAYISQDMDTPILWKMDRGIYPPYLIDCIRKYIEKCGQCWDPSILQTPRHNCRRQNV